MATFQFDWKANRNFCVTAKFSCDFETAEADPEDGKFLKYALKNSEHFTLIGYFKTVPDAVKAMNDSPLTWYYFFIWDRKGECIDGYY